MNVPDNKDFELAGTWAGMTRWQLLDSIIDSAIEEKVKEAFEAGFKAGYKADEPKDLTAYKEWADGK